MGIFKCDLRKQTDDNRTKYSHGCTILPQNYLTVLCFFNSVTWLGQRYIPATKFSIGIFDRSTPILGTPCLKKTESTFAPIRKIYEIRLIVCSHEFIGRNYTFLLAPLLSLRLARGYLM